MHACPRGVRIGSAVQRLTHAGRVPRCGGGGPSGTSQHSRASRARAGGLHTAFRPPPHPSFCLPPSADPVGAYVHLPFCKRKCLYCDFPVIALGRAVDNAAPVPAIEAYVESLEREIAATPAQNPHPLQSVYFGGGTPSLTPPPLVERLLHALERAYGIAPGAEVSFEADPGTFDAGRLRSLQALGVNRLSVGVQAFQDDLLRRCGRSHSVAEVHAAIEAIHAAGVPAWSLDLMSGLPGLDPGAWAASLEAAVAAAPTHVSVYDLQVEAGTPFAAMYRPGHEPLPSDDAAAAMFGQASECLRGAGYEHYEISNYALPGSRSRHNSMYWSGSSFYGFGMGAASYLQGRRFSRPKSLPAYLRWLEAYREGPRESPGAELPPESRRDVLLDAVMLRSRLRDGVWLTVLKDIAGDRRHEPALLSALEPHVAAGLAWLERDGEGAATRFGLTDPEGFLLSNDVVSDIFLALDES
ncbi:HEMN1 [Auxenochlorella protothecoides x Auxenochlorella symbiontica]